MKTLLLVGAVHSLGFAVFHAFFWKIFQWREVLPKTTLPVRAVIQIANCRLIYLFLGMAVLCLGWPGELLATPLGHAVLAGMSLFWLGRLIEQFVFLRVNDPRVHVLSALFALGAVLYAVPLLA